VSGESKASPFCRRRRTGRKKREVQQLASKTKKGVEIKLGAARPRHRAITSGRGEKRKEKGKPASCRKAFCLQKGRVDDKSWNAHNSVPKREKQSPIKKRRGV